MTEQESTTDQVSRALVASHATISGLLILCGLFLPVTTIHASRIGDSKESLATLWQDGLDNGFNDGGGGDAVLPALLLLVMVLTALTCVWWCALLLGGRIGTTGTTIAVVASVLLLIGALWLAFAIDSVADLALDWYELEDGVVETGPGVWLLLGGAVCFAATVLPSPVRRLWSTVDPARVDR